MKHINILFFLLFLPTILCSQGLINEIRTWNVVECCNPSRTKTYKFIGDTTINMKLYKKLYYSYSEYFTYSIKKYAAALREENQKVFINHSDTIENLLYDFNLDLNDTISFINDFNTDLVICVDSVDTILINGEYKKRLIFRNIEQYKYYESQTWIEDIGSTYGLIEVTAPHIADRSTDLLCVKDNDVLIYQTNFGTCYISTLSTESNFLDKAIKVFPNPSEGFVTIKFEDYLNKKILKIEIYNIIGEKIYEEMVSSQNDINVELPKNGVYIIKLIDKKLSIIKPLKIIKI